MTDPYAARPCGTIALDVPAEYVQPAKDYTHWEMCYPIISLLKTPKVVKRLAWVSASHRRSSTVSKLSVVYVGSCFYFYLLSLTSHFLIGSPVCFALASYNHQRVVHSVWGSSGTRPWRLLASPSRNPPASDGGLGLAVRMTRRADLGLGQLLGFIPDDEPDYEDGGWEEWNTALDGRDNLDLLGKSPKIAMKQSNPGSLGHDIGAQMNIQHPVH
jgi:hypothetical protein